MLEIGLGYLHRALEEWIWVGLGGVELVCI